MSKVSENLTFKPSVIFSSVSVVIMITLYSVCNQRVFNRTVQNPILFVMEIQMEIRMDYSSGKILSYNYNLEPSVDDFRFSSRNTYI